MHLQALHCSTTCSPSRVPSGRAEALARTAQLQAKRRPTWDLLSLLQVPGGPRESPFAFLRLASARRLSRPMLLEQQHRPASTDGVSSAGNDRRM